MLPGSLRVNRQRFLFCVVVFVLTISTLIIPRIADAAPKDGGTSAAKRKEAQRIQDQLDNLYDQMSALSEDANAAQLRLAIAERDVKEAKASAAETGANYDTTLTAVKTRIQRQYAQGEGISIKLSSSLNDNSRRQVYLSVAQNRSIDSIDALMAVKQDLDKDRAKAARAAKRAENEKKLAKNSLSKAQRLADRQEALLKSVKSDVARLLVVEEQQRLAAEAKRAKAAEAARKAAAVKEVERRKQAQAKLDAAAQAAAVKHPKLDGRVAPTKPTATMPDPATPEAPNKGTNPGDVRVLNDQALAAEAGQAPAVAAAPGAASAVATAKAQIGKPYVWGAAGESYYDCSGLMLFAWRAGGHSLPHSSRAQYAATRRVSQGQLQPGDILFFGSPIHHVGMYIGNGEMVEAPHRGALVRVRPIGRRDYVGAGRVG
jgi:peptidoglycan DL-endopeptidase CwlO